MKEWLSKKETFEVFDVRTLKGNFLPIILKKAQEKSIGEGLCVIQSFEPIPLYSALADLGFEHECIKENDNEYKVYFYKTENNEPKYKSGGNMPFKPTAIVNFNLIDPELANNVVNFWKYIWEKEDSAIDIQTRLLLSLANGVGAGRMRQAVREFIKGYALGIPMNVFDEVFAMFAWNQGVGYFSSEIGPSALFSAYKTAKQLEEKGVERSAIVEKLMEKYGENNPDVTTFG